MPLFYVSADPTCVINKYSLPQKAESENLFAEIRRFSPERAAVKLLHWTFARLRQLDEQVRQGSVNIEVIELS